MNDDDLFNWSPGAARHDDPETSHDAAHSVNATALEKECWEALVKFGDLTTEEIALRLGRPLQTVTPRLVPLERKGRVARTPLRRPGVSGRGRIVWHAL